MRAAAFGTTALGVMALGVALPLMMITGGCARLRLDRTPDAGLSPQVRAAATGGRPAYVMPDAGGRALWKKTRRFYETRAYAPAWLEGTRPNDQARALVDRIRGAAADGIDPALYNPDVLDARWQEASRGLLVKRGLAPAVAAGLDIQLTYTYLSFASDLAHGIADLSHADPAWQIDRAPFDAVAALDQAIAGGRVGQSLDDLRPTARQYAGLREALATYRQQAASGGWPTVPTRLRLEPGSSGAAVTAVARRLRASGDYRGAVAEDGRSMTYDAPLQDAVRRFQRHHGLDEDAVVGPAVAAAMNVGIEARIRQIELNLERWRWLPRDMGSRFVLVNIPAYRLEVWDRGRVPVSMRVVVGKQDAQTPIFDDRMTYLVFSPYWNVPPDIARDETLPSLLADPGFLERTNMEIVDQAGRVVDPREVEDDLAEQGYRIRQRPGGTNSLGLVKFMFPNQYNVYLHDTPADSLFARSTRSFSHGCVRVEDPAALAAYVLKDQPEWTPERIQEAMNAGEERTVRLTTPLPVYLGYWTASVGEDGAVRFARDVYGVDAKQEQRLAAKAAGMKKQAVLAAAAAAGLPSGKAAKPAVP